MEPGSYILEPMDKDFHQTLEKLMHEYVLLAYQLTKQYPRDEQYGLTSQDRRSAVSMMLNYVEGYARMRIAVQLNFYETAFGSLKESIYCRFLAQELKYISPDEYQKAFVLKERIAAMLYRSIEGMRKKL